MKDKQRRSTFVSLLFTVILMGFFLVIPLLRLLFPRLNYYFGFIPVFFFVPIFWSFSGRRRFLKQRKKHVSADDDSFGPYNTGVYGDFDEFMNKDMSQPKQSGWSYVKYFTIAAILILSIVLIYKYVL